MLDFTVHVVDSPKLDLVLKEIKKMIVELEDLKTKVTDLESASQSAVALLTLIKQKLDQVVSDANTLQELRDGVTEVASRIDADKQALADAVVANTPAA